MAQTLRGGGHTGHPLRGILSERAVTEHKPSTPPQDEPKPLPTKPLPTKSPKTLLKTMLMGRKS